MAQKSVEWTHTAMRQRRHVLKYWTDRNKSTDYAEKLIALIRERTNYIAEFPLAGKITTHLDTREASMGNFSIYYQVHEFKIYITAFWDNRQDPEKLIKLL